jgi:hypothetical protein
MMTIGCEIQIYKQIQESTIIEGYILGCVLNESGTCDANNKKHTVF